ncbi:alpha/beta hydrolase [Streptomyces sp. NPDC051569]|uniref:alpha/beta hydrolase n=1 Tax=Streptomyces sp. NPDC051569 TaxID=3365661 RepID=UPI0037ABC65F
MASDFARLMKQDFGDLEEAASAWRKLATEADEGVDRHRSQVTGPLHATWKGDDADRALFYLEDVESRLGIVQTEGMAIAVVLDDVRAEMSGAQTNLRNAVQRAEENHYTVDDDGRVSDPTTADLPHNDPDTRQIIQDRAGPRSEYQQWIDDALDMARKGSADGSRALGMLNGDVLDSTNHGGSAESAQDVRDAMKAVGLQAPQIPEKDPKAAAAWWDALSPEERREYATLYPREIGATDGLPTTVRDDANRTALTQELNAIEEGDPKALYPGASQDELNQRQHNLQLLRDRIEQGDSAPPGKELYVLGYDSEGEGRAIIAMGNPDTADHTGVLVPGTNTTMDSVPGQLTRLGKLQDAAGRNEPDGGSVAMVSWLGYDAPEASATDFNSVGGTGRAHDAAPDLRQFVEGTRASHEGPPSHTTVLGHSYGSTVVGAAAAGGQGLGADDVLVVGSPGMTVDRASDLQMDPDHVWAGGAKDDGVIDWASDLTLGDNPLEEPFGGRNFTVDTSGHSGYWDEGSASLDNQGKIIAGVPPAETPKEENDVPFLPW